MLHCNIFYRIISFLSHIRYNNLMDKNIKSILSTISNYCIENPEYCFWYSGKSNYYRLYLGYKTTYNKFKQGCPDFYGIINDKFIKETDMVFDFNLRDNAPLAKIQTYHDWDSQDMHRYKLFTYCRQRVDNEFLYVNCFSTFFSSKRESIDIEKCLNYGNFKNTKDWRFFTSNLIEEDWNKIWSNYSQINSLSDYFNKNFSLQEKKMFLEPLIQSKFLYEINEASLNFYQFLTTTFSLEDIKNYYHYPIVKSSLENTGVFNEDKEISVEKVITNQNIFKFKNYENYSATECNSIYVYIVNEMNDNLQLKKCGLAKIDILIDKQEYNNTFYINKIENSLFNTEHFKQLFIDVLSSYSNHTQIENLKEIIPTVVNNWYLQNILTSKPVKINQPKI